ncbi:MAG: glycosyltransferase family 4 protein [Planctomycetes bacterium]|nr:glycosyltransferase family 4 protein [Planctomycetota bacterium]
MRVLHLYGDHKWTGPAEPAVNLCVKLKEMGRHVHFACCPAPGGRPDMLESKARARGLKPVTDLHLNPALSLSNVTSAIRRVMGYMRTYNIEIVHVHQGRDHLIAGLAARHTRSAVRIVRTNYSADPLSADWRPRLLLRRHTDGLLDISVKAVQADLAASELPRDVVGHIHGAVDMERFDPTREFQDVRARFGLRPDDVVVGIVARLQRHRKFDLYLKAIKIASESAPGIRGLVLGRGTHMKRVGIDAARRMGLGETIVFPGYVGEDYEATLAAFDMKVFLVPGSDGSCRAVLEAMAMARPVIAAKRGILPEIIEHGRTGILVEDDPHEIAEWILRLAGHPALRRTLGAMARKTAEREFTLEAQAEAVSRLYDSVMARKKAKAG